MTAICILLLSFGSDAYTDFQTRGDAAYRAGDFAGAARAYEELAASGVWNAEVYFNFANVCYHLGDKGGAVLNYERALGIDPGFQPAGRNLELVIAETTNKLERPEGFALTSGAGSRAPGLSERTLRLSLLVFWWFVWGILIRGNRGVAYSRRATLALWSLLGLCAVVLAIPAPAIQSAVVIAAQAPLHYGPDVLDPVRASLAAGDRILVDRVDGAWARVETASGVRGWLEVEEVAFAGPPFTRRLTDRE